MTPATAHAAPRIALNGMFFLGKTLNLLPLILVHAGAVAIIFTESTLIEWLALPLVVLARGLLVTVGYHRYFSHRAFKTSRPMQLLLAFLGCANLQQGPLWWASHHRQHHSHSDEAGDVHSPYHGGLFWAYFGWLWYPFPDPNHRVRDWRRYPELVWLERFWHVPGLLIAGLCWWFGGVSCLCIDFCLSAVIIFHICFLVNTVGHMNGSRRFATGDHSRNNVLLGVIGVGEGWHNNHHQYPTSAKLGLAWWELDVGYQTIWILERLGLVWDVRRPDSGMMKESGDDNSTS